MIGKLYVVFGGNITSKNDRKWHYVSARNVAQLYGLNPNDCIFVSESTPINDKTGLPYGVPDIGFGRLYPQSNGDYSRIPKHNFKINKDQEIGK